MNECERLHTLRERCESMARTHVAIRDFLETLKGVDVDQITVQLLIDQIEQDDYDNDLAFPENFTCDIKK